MRLSTETGKDTIETVKTLESEFVQPYQWDSYKEMEYFLLSPPGQANARSETPWDTPWAQAQDSEVFEDYYKGVETASSKYIHATYITTANTYTQRWYDYSSANVCEEIVSGAELQFEKQNYSLSSQQHCGLTFYETVQRIRESAILFPGVVTYFAPFEKVYLRLFAPGSWTDRTISWNFYGNDVGGAVIPSTYDDYYSKTLTSSYAAMVWSGAQGSPGTYFDYDVTGPVNEIINRGDWSSGNDLQIITRDVTAVSGIRAISFRGVDAALAERPRLITTFEK